MGWVVGGVSGARVRGGERKILMATGGWELTVSNGVERQSGMSSALLRREKGRR